MTWRLHEGYESLEIVGEASYQSALWSLCGGMLGERIRYDVIAVLVPEPHDRYDPNAISVRIDGETVGYFPRAAVYVSGLRQLMSRSGAYVALRGVIVGGGYFDDGPGRLGVWLHHDPADFGIVSRGPTYDLSWSSALPVADRPAIAILRNLLARERDPIDRHFQFAELESRLYRVRDLYGSALAEFDETCRRHDAEMDLIRQAFMAEWRTVPLLDVYPQMAIRQYKAKDWSACLWWCERGLAIYGDDAAREDAVEDLLVRRNRALAKLGERV